MNKKKEKDIQLIICAVAAIIIIVAAIPLINIARLSMAGDNVYEKTVVHADASYIKGKVELKYMTVIPRDSDDQERPMVISSGGFPKELEVPKGGNMLITMQFKNVGDKHMHFSYGLQALSDEGLIGDIIYEPHKGQESGEGSIRFNPVESGKEAAFTHHIKFGEHGATVKVWLKMRYVEYVEQTGAFGKILTFNQQLYSNTITIIEVAEIDVVTVQ
jgi:hypothetical protein